MKRLCRPSADQVNKMIRAFPDLLHESDIYNGKKEYIVFAVDQFSWEAENVFL